MLKAPEKLNWILALNSRTWVRILCLTWLVVLCAYALAMGAWSTSLKYLDLSNHNVRNDWEALERFAPSNGVAYALIAATVVAVFGIRWTNVRSSPPTT